MKKPIRINLFNQATIQQAIKDIQDYKKEITNNTKKFCDELSKIGIDIIKVNLGDDAIHIGLIKKIEISESECKEILILADKHPVTKAWLSIDENHKEIMKTAEISPVLMLEFGSGKDASAAKKHTDTVNVKEKVGRGTFPSENNKPKGNENHAWQDIWKYKDIHGRWKRTSGITPTMPMYNAYLEMERQIRQIAREIFKT